MITIEAVAEIHQAAVALAQADHHLPAAAVAVLQVAAADHHLPADQAEDQDRVEICF